MKAKDVQIGKTYIVKVSGKFCRVRVTREIIAPWTGWIGKNLDTGREINIRSAARFRREFLPDCADCRKDVRR
jgi:hypothetical protein